MKLGDLLADAAEAQRHREDVGGEDEEQDVAAEIDRVVHRLDEPPRRESPIVTPSRIDSTQPITAASVVVTTPK